MKHVKLNIFIASACAVASVQMYTNQAQAAPVATSQQQYIVTYKDSINETKKQKLKESGARVIKDIELVNGIVVVADSNAVKTIAKTEGVKNVEIDALVSIDETYPAGTLQTLPWGVDRVDAEKAWVKSRGLNAKVAVIDTGIDKLHEDLVGNIYGGVNFVKNNSGVIDSTAWNDDHGHGTHVAGTVGAIDNGVGVIGVAPSVKLYGVKSLSSSGGGNVSDVIKGIEWSIINKMDVVTMSLSTGTHVRALQDAVTKASKYGVIVVAAAGNAGDGNPVTNEVRYPAKYSTVIAVGATDSADNIANFSSDGAEVAVSAPGVNILSTTMGGAYGTKSGTSMATPHVAGTIALMITSTIPVAADKDRSGKWSVSEVKSYLQVTADDLGNAGKDVFFGAGIIDTVHAVTGIES